MKSNSGFTLIELIAVGSILTIIALIATPIVFKSINNSKDKSFIEQTKVLEETAQRWSIKHTDLLSETTPYYLEINQLVADKLLPSNDIIDPRNNQKMNGCIVISYNKENVQYIFKYNENTCATLKK